MDNLYKRIAALSPERFFLFKKRLKEEGIDFDPIQYGLKNTGANEFPPIEASEKKEYYPLTSAQKRLFAVHQFENPSTVYNVYSIKLMEGPMDKKQVAYAFKTILARHEVFRTAFIFVEGEPFQRVFEFKDVDFEIDYLETGLNPDEPGTRDFINGYIKPFELDKAPLLRVVFIKISAEKYILLYDTHHIIADGNSKGIIAREFLGLYNGRSLPQLKVQYKDFSVWHQDEKVKIAVKRQELYWLNEFKGDIPVLQLPIDYPRPAQKSYEGNSISFNIPVKETNALKMLALKINSTLFTVLLAIYNILLAKISRQEDIIIGIPASGRHHPGLNEIVGMFVNTLVLRNFPIPGISFERFLLNVKQRTLDVFENQDFSFEDLVNNVVKQRDMGRNPIFDVFFSFNYPGVIKQELPGHTGYEKSSALKITSYEGDVNLSIFDLFLSGAEVENELHLGFTYAAKLFNQETIQRLTGYFQDIVSTISENNQVLLKDIKISHELGMAGSKILQDEIIENDFGF
ncbi:MAG: condensation domain-containing protein [Acidobacteria bacterium]|jgi:hypothetical protein|nr:condensation domain-containing protein [Acidobacteriota bacterium]